MLLHAITSYPTHAEDVNLRAIRTLKKAFPDLQIGYSDHTMNPLACLYAAAMGATIIEKHFTYDKNADGPDHQLSADPEEMNYIVKSIRNLDVLAGTGIKLPAASEKTTRINNRKSLIAARHISKGSVISENDVVIKRPGTGIPPTFLDQVIGRTVGVDLNEDDVINWSSFC